MHIHHQKWEIISFYQFTHQRDLFIEEALQNKIFVYPTDTLYGIGWVFNHKNIEKINLMKGRNTSKKLTIIAPTFERIFENFYVKNPEYIIKSFAEHHGVTYILEPRNPTWEYSLYETAYDDNTIGVRIIKHPFQDFVAELWIPFIATSANFAAGPNIHNIHELSDTIASAADYIIDGNEVYWIPSVIIYPETETVVHRQ
jgi:tRNA A37 threonylcarbamoyladenosine synthetase subunit TsaC/SUA5/YrdC